MLGVKVQDLTERLLESLEHLEKIAKCGKEMDGNASDGDEDEFIFALAEQMPEVFQGIEKTKDLLQASEDLAKETKMTLNLEKMADLKDKVNRATENVEESESLVIKLEKEIMNWNPVQKLCRRDEELEDFTTQC